MTISTYSELKTAIADWAHRTDLTAKLPDFIYLAESRINRVIRFNEQESEIPLTATVGSRYIDLPSGFIAPIELWFTYYNPRDLLRFLPAEQMPLAISSGEPEYWTIDGDKIALDSEADIAYTYEFRYRSKITLSDANPTNWLLTEHPDVYLYAALMEEAVYVRDTEQLSVWKGAFDIALQEVLDKEHRTKSLTTLSTELSFRETTNIFEG
jgi:hypothetical protein